MGQKWKKKLKQQRAEEEEEEEDFSEDDAAQESDEEEAQAGPSGREPRAAIYDVDAIHDKLEDLAWDAEWTETQAITSAEPTQVSNIDDDMERELAFYNQALAAAQQAIQQFDAAGIPWLRPADYYAEMVKSDQHMAKVKQQLMFEQQQIEQAEERRKQREAKLYGKQVQQQREREKQQDKKRQIEQISKLRKNREKSGFQGELDMEAELKNLSHKPVNMKRLGDRMPGAKHLVNKKRLQKNAKYGFGGRKGLKKQNDAYSAADMDGYKRMSPRGGGVQKGGRGGKKGGNKGGGGQRPGKARRQAMKGNK